MLFCACTLGSDEPCWDRQLGPSRGRFSEGPSRKMMLRIEGFAENQAHAYRNLTKIKSLCCCRNFASNREKLAQMLQNTKDTQKNQ